MNTESVTALANKSDEEPKNMTHTLFMSVRKRISPFFLIRLA